MEKICIELEISEWDDIEEALKLAGICEMELAEKAEPFLESAQREHIAEWIEKHKEHAGKYRNLSKEIRIQVSEAIRKYAESAEQV